MEIFNAMDLVCRIHSEGNSIQTFVADNTDETVWVIGLACCSQDSVQDWGEAFAAFLQGVGVVSLAEWVAIYRVEWKTLQATVALRAGEAKDVIQSAHGAAARPFTNNPIITLDAGSKVITVRRAVGQRLEMLLLQYCSTSFRREDWFINPIHIVCELHLLQLVPSQHVRLQKKSELIKETPNITWL